jgi:hypothetical protein
VRHFAEQGLTRKSRLLEPHGDRDGDSGCKWLPGRGVAGEDLSGVDPRPDLEREPVVTLELIIEAGERLFHLVCGAGGAECVVLVHLRHAEDRHCGVADELLDRAVVPLDDRADGVEVAPHDAAEDLRIERCPQAGEVDNVHEEDGDGLAPFFT